MCAQKEKGGLGLRKIIFLNKALLGKWVWRFAIEKNNLWKKVLLMKYGQEGFGWRTNEVRGTYGVGVWKEILKEACWCWDNFQLKVGKGTKIKFWTDHWCDNATLSQIFPQLLLWRSIGMQQLMKCGALVLVKEVGISNSLEILMIGSWI